MTKYRIWFDNGESKIVIKDENGIFKDVLTLKRYQLSELKTFNAIHDCADCIHISTPKGKQCYTISRVLKEKTRDLGLPFYPGNVIPVLDELGEKCKRFRAQERESTEINM
jgi:hypothetical protein